VSGAGKFANRHVLVTGAGSGIGAAIARAVAAEGAHVTLAGRRRDPLAALAAELPARACFIADGFDVTKPDAIATGLDAAGKAFGPVDILVNNAGEAPSAPFAKTSLDMWSHVMAVDLSGVFLVTQAVLPDLKARGAQKGDARILNIASIAGLKGFAYVSAYCAAKHGVIGLTRALAHEFAKTGITVNAICPGYTDTPMVEKAVEAIVAKTGRKPEEVVKELAKDNPQGRLVTPEEVAAATLFAASPGSGSINGQAIVVAGGEVMAG
jgi:NAD(P)-dependent dehydrogenase (short-subunit alcohol dehydrogenase family)